MEQSKPTLHSHSNMNHTLTRIHAWPHTTTRTQSRLQ